MKYLLNLRSLCIEVVDVVREGGEGESYVQRIEIEIGSVTKVPAHPSSGKKKEKVVVCTTGR